VAVATHNAGKTLLEAGRAAEAESTLALAVTIARRFFPADHVNVAIFESTYGRALLARGRYAEAERLLKPAHARIAAALGDDHPRTREVAGDLETLYRRWGRPRPAT
jgi:Flp pilus assembly protein TadD